MPRKTVRKNEDSLAITENKTIEENATIEIGQTTVEKSGLCPVCGTYLKITDSDGDWLECLTPDSFEWSLPAGKITDPAGRVWYIDPFGKRYIKEDYIAKYKIDPEIALKNMRKNRPPMKLGNIY